MQNAIGTFYSYGRSQKLNPHPEIGSVLSRCTTQKERADYGPKDTVGKLGYPEASLLPAPDTEAFLPRRKVAVGTKR